MEVVLLTGGVSNVVIETGDAMSLIESSVDVLEGTTPILRMTLVDSAQAPLTVLGSLTLSYYDKESEDIINNRDNQDVLNLNGVTFGIAGAGVIEWKLTALDTVILDQRKELEFRIALFTWTWDSGTRIDAQEIGITIENLQTP